MRSFWTAAALVSTSAAGLAFGAQSRGPRLSEEASGAIPDVVRRMRSEDPETREALIRDLIAGAENGRHSTSLRYALSDVDYSAILTHALRGLAQHLPEERALRVLLTVLCVSKEHSLVGVDAPVAEFARSSSPTVARFAVKVLIALKSPRATPHLIPRLKSKQRSEVYRALKDVVAVRGVQAVPQIRKLLGHEHKNIQHWAVWALYEFHAEDCKGDLYSRFVEGREWRDTDPFVLAVLAKWEDTRVFPTVMNWLGQDDAGIRDRMMSRLVEVNATPIENPIIDFLTSQLSCAGTTRVGQNTMADALRLLGRLKSRRAVPLLRRIASSDNTFLSGIAAEQLGRLAAREAIPDLHVMLKKGDYPSWSAATLALARIGSPQAAATVVTELQKRRPNAHHVNVLEKLAKASGPKAYARLETFHAERMTGAHVDDYFAQFGRRFKIRVCVSDGVAKEHRRRGVSGLGRPTGLAALRRGISTLNYDSYNYALFVEDDCIHVLPISEAYEKWKAWLRTQPRDSDASQQRPQTRREAPLR